MEAITFNEVKSEVMLLSIQDRAILVRELLESLDNTEAKDIEDAWVIEAEKRYAAYQAGTVKTHSATEVFTKLESQLK